MSKKVKMTKPKKQVDKHKDPSEDQMATSEEESSSYSVGSSEVAIARTKLIGRDHHPKSKLSKNEIKRLRNRQAAKKSRRLKKQHTEALMQQNERLKMENQRLMNELRALKEGTVLVKSQSKMSIEANGSREDTTKPESTLPVNEIQPEPKQPTEDDLRYQRLIQQDEQKHNNWQKFFFAFALLTLMLWINAFDGLSWGFLKTPIVRSLYVEDSGL